MDYDALPNPFFNLTVYAQDIDPTHVDTAYVEIRVTDANDNAPLFLPDTKKVLRAADISLQHNRGGSRKNIWGPGSPIERAHNQKRGP